MSTIGNYSKNVYEAAAKLYAEDIIEKMNHDSSLRYGKIAFYSHNRDKILRLAKNKKALDKFPTRHSPQVRGSTIVVYQSRQVRIEEVHAEDFKGFKRIVGRRPVAKPVKPLPEERIKKGFKTLLHESGKTGDWGGEQNDIFTRTIVKGSRRSVAMALKGPATKGTLVPAKMGKNGDQVERLFTSPADVYMVQFHGTIGANILDLMRSLAVANSLRFEKKTYFGIIDGQDTAKILEAYPEAFK
jgi:hypothetical protein